MKSAMRAAIVASGTVVLGVGLAGCGSDNQTAPSTSSTGTAAVSSTTTAAAKPEKTIAEYVQENNIVETPVHRGDPGSPTIDLPVPPGWNDASSRAPEGAYAAMVLPSPETPADPPNLIVYVAKLAGNVDAAKIIEYAPAEIQTLPGYEGPQVGTPTKFGGFDATQIGGSYTKNGVKRAVGQMTAVIPAQDGLYVAQVNADSQGKPDQVRALTIATGVLAGEAKITP
jgi:hypothetical protein